MLTNVPYPHKMFVTIYFLRVGFATQYSFPCFKRRNCSGEGRQTRRTYNNGDNNINIFLLCLLFRQIPGLTFVPFHADEFNTSFSVHYAYASPCFSAARPIHAHHQRFILSELIAPQYPSFVNYTDRKNKTR